MHRQAFHLSPGLRGILAGLACALAAWYLARLDIFVGLEDWLHDGAFLARGKRSTRSKVVIIGIDSQSLRKLKKGTYYLSPELAQVVRYTHAQGASAIGVDLLIPDDLSDRPDIAAAGSEGDARPMGAAIRDRRQCRCAALENRRRRGRGGGRIGRLAAAAAPVAAQGARPGVTSGHRPRRGQPVRGRRPVRPPGAAPGARGGRAAGGGRGSPHRLRPGSLLPGAVPRAAPPAPVRRKRRLGPRPRGHPGGRPRADADQLRRPARQLPHHPLLESPRRRPTRAVDARTRRRRGADRRHRPRVPGCPRHAVRQPLRPLDSRRQNGAPHGRHRTSGARLRDDRGPRLHPHAALVGVVRRGAVRSG